MKLIMVNKGWMRLGVVLLAGLVMLAGCTAKTAVPPVSEAGGLFATAKGKVTRISHVDSWFELRPKSGGEKLTINYDATTTLLNFKGMIEIAREQPVEVTYMPGAEPPNRAISIRKLQPDECN